MTNFVVSGKINKEPGFVYISKAMAHNNIDLYKNLEIILSEDKELLEKLAQ